MTSLSDLRLSSKHEAVLDRFVAACQADDRIIAAFIGGSHAANTADAFSDLDLYVTLADESFQDFLLYKDLFVHRLGEALFIEDFDIPDALFFILADSTEGEIGFAPKSLFKAIHTGPYRVLVDKTGILNGAVFTGRMRNPLDQSEKLRRLINWFWHDLSHFITAMGRGELWWAQGQLEELRRFCVNLARMRQNFLDPEVGDEPYFKLEQAMPVEQLSALRETFGAMDADVLLQSCFAIVQFYQDLAVPLAEANSIPYPEKLEEMMVHRLEALGQLR